MMGYVVYDLSFAVPFQFLTPPHSFISRTFRVGINKLTVSVRLLFIKRTEHTDRVRNKIVLLQEDVDMSSGLLYTRKDCKIIDGFWIQIGSLMMSSTPLLTLFFLFSNMSKRRPWRLTTPFLLGRWIQIYVRSFRRWYQCYQV